MADRLVNLDELIENQPLIRALEVHDKKAKAHFTKLEAFFGTQAVSDRVAAIEREINSEKGTYLHEWVLPNRSWWLGFQKAREMIKQGQSFRGNLPQIVLRPLQTAAVIRALYRSMPEATRREFRQRILNEDLLEPVLLELESAAHFWEHGYEIKWVQVDEPGVRSPEFLAINPEHTIQVECKTKTTDVGRMVRRKNFYRLLDTLALHLDSISLTGSIRIEIEKKMPSSIDWRKAVAKTIATHAHAGQHVVHVENSAGTKIIFDLQDGDGSVLSQSEIPKLINQIRTPYIHAAVHNQNQDEIVDPLVIQLSSQKPDQYLQAVLKDLRDANKQLTFEHPALIVCYIPEIASFAGLEKGSSLQAMTHKFFDEHARELVYGVTFCSTNRQHKADAVSVSMAMPALAFFNPNYDARFGVGFPSISS